MKTIFTYLTLAAFLVISFVSLLFGQGDGRKPAVPDDAVQAESVRLIEEVYRDEFAKAKTSVEKQSLAKKLLVTASQTKDDPASAFVLLKMAKGLATQSGDRPLAFQAIDAMADKFHVSVVDLKAEVLVEFNSTARKASQRKSIVEEAFKLIDQAISENRVMVAHELGKLALANAQKAGENELISQAKCRIAEATELAKALEAVKVAKVTLENTPDDPQANLVMGKHICFVEGDWDTGRPMLMFGTDNVLKALAKQEIDASASTTEQLKLGDDWWDLAEKQDGMLRKGMQRRAGYWYQLVLPQLSGLAKDKVAKRLDQATQLSTATLKSKWMLIFRSADSAVWNSDSIDPKCFAISIANVPDNIKYLKIQLDPKTFVIVPMSKKNIGMESSGTKFGWEGRNRIVWGGRQLGVFDKSINIGKAGYAGGPCIAYEEGVGGFSGYGFGYTPGVNNQGYGWGGKAIAKTTIEIYVTSDSLSPFEKEYLLD
jgi:hypothetical protein